MPSRLITKIERQKRATHRVSIHLDGDFAFGANEEIVYRFHLAKGGELSEQDLHRIREYNDFLDAKNSALRFLSRRKHSTRELRLKLTKKGYGPGTAEEVTGHLLEIGLLDDAAFARSYVRDRLLLKPAGRKSLLLALKKRGIPEDLAEEVLRELVHDAGETESAWKTARTYAARLHRFDSLTRRRRMFAFLQRRGYAAELAGKITDELVPADGE